MDHLARPGHGSGDGWVTCAQGHQHWGLFGAAGLLIRPATEDPQLLLQLRASWSHHGGTWGLPGGARDEGETPFETAVREAHEEVGLDPADVRAEASIIDDHGGWTYTTIVASSPRTPEVSPTGSETDALRWVPDDEVTDLPLHPGFAHSWPELRQVGIAPQLVVDAANVIGCRPDGWWRDRAGAVVRLRDELATALQAGFPVKALGQRIFPAITLVTEGPARAVEPVDGIAVVAASGAGDDTIVEVAEAAAEGPREVVAVTADRELRRRLEGVAASVWRPKALLDLLPFRPAPDDVAKRRRSDRQ